jgi:hypothetical protein
VDQVNLDNKVAQLRGDNRSLIFAIFIRFSFLEILKYFLEAQFAVEQTYAISPVVYSGERPGI